MHAPLSLSRPQVPGGLSEFLNYLIRGDIRVRCGQDRTALAAGLRRLCAQPAGRPGAGAHRPQAIAAGLILLQGLGRGLRKPVGLR